MCEREGDIFPYNCASLLLSAHYFVAALAFLQRESALKGINNPAYNIVSPTSGYDTVGADSDATGKKQHQEMSEAAEDTGRGGMVNANYSVASQAMANVNYKEAMAAVNGKRRRN